MEKKKNSAGFKDSLKNLNKEDKAKIGEIIHRLAAEKREKSILEEMVLQLEEQVKYLKAERDEAIEEKEKMKSKLEKCMGLMKEIPRPSHVLKIDVFSQTNDLGDYSKPMQNSDFISSTYDERLFKEIENIENDEFDEIDPVLFKIVEEFERSG